MAKTAGELKSSSTRWTRRLPPRRRAGNAGEARRQIAKGLALLAGTPWTPALDFQNSLVIRSERTIADSAALYTRAAGADLQAAIDLTRPRGARVRS